jgi:membrane associated rhomboid family serine protease
VIPLHDNVPTRTRPVVTVALILINIAVFIVEITAPVQHLRTRAGNVVPVDGFSAVTAEYGFVPCEVQDRCPLGDDTVNFGANAPIVVHHVSEVVTAFTAMFLHGGWAHLIFNMLFLWIFGNNVEDRLGHVRFLLFYLVGGLCALGLQWAADPTSSVPTIGASGAIAAVLAGYLLLYPRAVIITLFGWIPLPVPAVFFLPFWFLLQIFGATQGFTAVGNSSGGVAYFAHVGGFIFGLIAVKLLDRGAPPPRRAVWS